MTLTDSINPSEGRPGLFAILIASSGNSQFTFTSAGIAEEYALYAVTFGTVLDPAFASSMTPLVSNNGIDPGSSVQMFSVGQSRYFGYWDDRQPFTSATAMPDAYDSYGWALITCMPSGLEVSSSATALGGGIIAGTFTSVPEPTVPTLLVVAGGLWFCGRRFRCRTVVPPNTSWHLTPTAPSAVAQKLWRDK